MSSKMSNRRRMGTALFLMAALACRKERMARPDHHGAATANKSQAEVDRVRCLHYEPEESQVSGIFGMEWHYGPPGFGEDPQHDERLRVPVLKLDSVATVCESPADPINSEMVTDVQAMELVFLPPSTVPEKLAGRRVFVRGRLFHSHTAWHFTPVLIQVDTLWPVVQPRLAFRVGG